MNRYFILLVSCFSILNSMELLPEFLAYETQAAQEISRIEAFITSDFTCDQNGIVSYPHFVTHARAATTFRRLYITRTQVPYPPYQEHISTMWNYLSILHRVLQHSITREKYLADPFNFEPICKKIELLTAAESDEQKIHKKTVTVYKSITTQDLAPIAALNFYAFMTFLDLEGYEKRYGQNEKNKYTQYRTELIQACNQQSIDQIRILLAQHKTFFLLPYQRHSACSIVERWIDNERRDFRDNHQK